MGNCFGAESTSVEAEMGKAQSKSSGGGSTFVSGLRSRTKSGKKESSSESTGFPSDIFSENLSNDRAKKIKIDPSQIDFGFQRQFHDEYEVTKLLGKGAFASAYQVSPRETSRFYGRYDLAVKVISKTSLKTVQVREDIEMGGPCALVFFHRLIHTLTVPAFSAPSSVCSCWCCCCLFFFFQDVRGLKQEIDIMKLVGGSINMVHVYDCYESKNHVYILMELCSGGNLFEKISKGDPYTEKMAAVLMGDILRVAEQCHSRGIIHRWAKKKRN